MVPRLWDLLDAAAQGGGFIVPVGQDTLIRRVRDAAEAAKVSNAAGLVFHSLRGMAASLATKNGAAFQAIAEGLGHTSYEMTAQHYATQDSQGVAHTKAAMTVLQGGRR
jgi:integrase